MTIIADSNFAISRNLSEEKVARDWTLSENDKLEINKYRKIFRPFIAVQLCAIRLYGRFLGGISDLSPQIINYINHQIDLPPSLSIQVPEREATFLQHRKNILNYLNFCKFDETTQAQLQAWLQQQADQGKLPAELLHKAEEYLLAERIVLPGKSTIERMVIHVCSQAHNQLFESIYDQLSPSLRNSIDQLLIVSEGDQGSYFQKLKEYPPSGNISSIKDYLKRYRTLSETGIDDFEARTVDPAFLEFLFKLAKRYSAKDLKRFKEHKKYALMSCFLLEIHKIILDHVVKMHEQFIMDLCRQCKNIHEKKHRALRKRQKKAIDTILNVTQVLFELPEGQPLYKTDILEQTDEKRLRESVEDLRIFKRLEERGYGDLLLARYPSLRKYFAEFLLLPFAVAQGSEELLRAIQIVRKLDSGELKTIPEDSPTSFVPKELRKALINKDGNINRNAWETGLALAIKAAFSSGDIYLPQSKQHVSFWDLMLNDSSWEESREVSFAELKQPQQDEIKPEIIRQFYEKVALALKHFDGDNFAQINNGKLKLKRYDKIILPANIVNLQKAINASMPSIRIEQLLMEVDQLTGFCRHFKPIQNHHSRPKQFYRTLIATLISQATNLGVVSMSASVQGVSVDMLRHVLHYYIREETLKAASADIVNQHHQLPLSAVHGSGTLSSSDGQRFKIRADSLLASYYPRYYGYYEKAIGIYTHVSDQHSVFSTKIISCSPREALYVLDGLLENNTVLGIREHTTDTHGYTEIIFALCHLLGYYFMPRIRDLKDQQLYRTDKNVEYGVFNQLLTKTVDLAIIEEQWDAMIRVAISLKKRTAPAHVIVQRLTNKFPSDRLSKAFTNLGRIIKTEYILRYLTDPELRRTVQLQLNKGEYRHKLPRWIFFADQGEFCTGDYEEIMNKASCLSLVSNAILYWNTIKINNIVEGLRDQGEELEDKTLSHISLLPFKHVLPNGTYFVNESGGEI